MLAPIVLFTYNRLWHTQQTVEALQKNILSRESVLIIYSDGPKTVQDQKKVEEVRSYIKTITGFKEVIIVEREYNIGLASSIIAGVTEVIEKYGVIIVLEDDLVTSPYFLQYMNTALNIYASEQSVMSVHGYIPTLLGQQPETYFLSQIDSCGWGTWKRSWDLFEPDGAKLLSQIESQKQSYMFDLRNSYHLTLMLKQQIVGMTRSWAIRWYASAFLNKKLGLYPRQSLVKNIGFDNSGSNVGNVTVFDVELTSTPIQVVKIPVVEDAQAMMAVEHFFKQPKHFLFFKVMHLKNWFQYIWYRIRHNV